MCKKNQVQQGKRLVSEKDTAFVWFLRQFQVWRSTAVHCSPLFTAKQPEKDRGKLVKLTDGMQKDWQRSWKSSFPQSTSPNLFKCFVGFYIGKFVCFFVMFYIWQLNMLCWRGKTDVCVCQTAASYSVLQLVYSAGPPCLWPCDLIWLLH